MIRLPDGRDLEVQVTGPEDGGLLLFHAGTPGACEQDRIMVTAVHRRGLRLVTWSRPGYGRSTRRAGRCVGDDVQDVAAVLDHLGADTCLVGGWSGGGPYALACGALLADRVRGVLCAFTLAPYGAEGLDWTAGMGAGNVEELGTALLGETPLRALLEEERTGMVDVTVDQIADMLEEMLPPVDRAAMTEEFVESVASGWRQALGPGVDGWLDDDLACVTPWGFDVTDIRVPTSLWHGSEDVLAPFSHGQWLAAHIPGVEAHLEQGEGHLSLGLGKLEDMLDSLARH